RAEFEEKLQWLSKWGDSTLVDIILIILVYSGLYVRETRLLNLPDFYAPWLVREGKIVAAGWWYIVFSLPLLQLTIYRWLYSTITWIVFLWKIAHIDLKLSSLHPDGMG